MFLWRSLSPAALAVAAAALTRGKPPVKPPQDVAAPADPATGDGRAEGIAKN